MKRRDKGGSGGGGTGGQADRVQLPPWVAAAPFVLLAVLFGAHVRLFYWLCDDAFISFRYARNLIDGYGLVFNPGERVEGYTNFLWVLEIAALWKLLFLRPEISANLLSILCSAGAAVCVYKMCPCRLSAWAALLLLAVNRNVAVWTTSGLETRQFTFFVVWAVYLIGSAAGGKERGRLLLASAALAGAALTRPEGLMCWGLAVCWLALDRGSRSQPVLKPVVWLAVPFLVLAGAHLNFRIFYYGDLLPNTYYAKHLQAWPDAGFAYFAAAAAEGGLYLLVPLALAGAAVRAATGGGPVHTLSFLLMAAHAFYLLQIGGDHFEFRPLDFYWPLLAVPAAETLAAGARGCGALAARMHAAARSTASAAVFGAALLLVLAYTTVLQIGKYAVTYDKTTRQETLRMATPITPEQFPAGFLLPGMTTVAGVYNHANAFCSGHAIACSHQELAIFWKLQEKNFRPYEQAGRELLPPDSLIAIPAIGVGPFCLPGLRVIDILGLTDRHVARMEIEKPNKLRNMAHDRLADLGYLYERGLNLDPRNATPTAQQAFLEGGGEFALRVSDKAWMPFNTYNPDWARKAFAGKPVFTSRYVRAISFFHEGSMDGWELRGFAMEDQPKKRPYGRVRGVVRDGCIHTHHPVMGGFATGEAMSPPFCAEENQFLQFRFGGGWDSDVGLAVFVEGYQMTEYTGRNYHDVALLRYDLSPFAGKEIQVLAFDYSEREQGSMVLADVAIVEMPPVPAFPR